jgi:hypothetical protein
VAFGLLVNFTIVTVIFMALQKREGSLGAAWTSETPGTGLFPPSKRIGDAWFRTPQGIRTKAGAAFLVQAALLAIWFTVPRAGLFVVAFPGTLFLDPGPAVPWVERVMVGMLAAHCGLSAFTFAFPDQPLARKVLHFSLDLAGMALLAWGLQHGAWRIAAGGGDLRVEGQPVAEMVNEIVHWILRGALAVQLVTLPLRVWKLFRRAGGA